jgi:hypothetical protein
MTAPMMIGLPVAALVPVLVPLLLLLVVLLLLLDPQPATTIARTASAHSATDHALILLIESPFRCARDPLGSWSLTFTYRAPQWVVLP